MMNKGQKIILPVKPTDEGRDLMAYIDANRRYFARHDASAWLASGCFQLNGQPAAGHELLYPGCELMLYRPPWEEPAVPNAIPVLFSSPDLVIVDKPAGMPVTPTGDYLENSVLHRLRRDLKNDTLSPIHRLDLETSGVMAFAARKEARRLFQCQFQNGEVQKHYQALVFGRFEAQRREIDAALGSDQLIYTRKVLDPKGKPALTRILSVSFWHDFSLLELVPVTGRTNQIRAHLAGVGHSIVGDKKYFPDPAIYLDWVAHRDFERIRSAVLLDRQALHCRVLTLMVDGSPQSFYSQYPAVAFWRAGLGFTSGDPVVSPYP